MAGGQTPAQKKLRCELKLKTGFEARHSCISHFLQVTFKMKSTQLSHLGDGLGDIDVLKDGKYQCSKSGHDLTASITSSDTSGSS